MLAVLEERGFGRLVAHAPYTLNPCSPDERVRSFCHMAMKEDLASLRSIPTCDYNLHPGSHVGQGIEVGIDRIVEMLDSVMEPDAPNWVLLETMSGGGSEVGGRFEHLAEIIARARFSRGLGVCMDLCHVYAAGYDVRDGLDGVLSEFDRVIGLNRLRAVHLNDSLHPIGAHKDRHAVTGEGTIGMDAILRAMTNPALRALPFVLETPLDDEGHAQEIERLRRGVEEIEARP